MTDLESNRPFLLNETVQSLSWSDITVSVKNRDLIHNINGNVQQGKFYLRFQYKLKKC